jgi:hypothetical protein
MLVSGEERRNLRYVHGEEAMLQGVPVRSNSTTLMHSEEVFELGGKISLKRDVTGGYQLDNQTSLKLQGVGLIEKDSVGNINAAWIGTIEAGAKKTVVGFFPPDTRAESRLWAEFRDKEPLTGANPHVGDLNLREILNFAERTDEMRPGEIKMVGWADEELPGLSISPTSAQSRHAVLVVAHLAYGKDPAPQPDLNIPRNPMPAKREIGNDE